MPDLLIWAARFLARVLTKQRARLEHLVFVLHTSWGSEDASNNAGFAGIAETDADLVEWNYGEYEGLRSAEILAKRSDWQLFRDGCPGGESPIQISKRADRVVQRVRSVGGDVLLFSSGHFTRVLAARWLDLDLGCAAKYLLLNPASLSALGYEHKPSQPVIRLWNDDHHVIA